MFLSRSYCYLEIPPSFYLNPRIQELLYCFCRVLRMVLYDTFYRILLDDIIGRSDHTQFNRFNEPLWFSSPSNRHTSGSIVIADCVWFSTVVCTDTLRNLNLILNQSIRIFNHSDIWGDLFHRTTFYEMFIPIFDISFF